MAPPKSTVPPPAQPRFGTLYDVYNSSGTGHQRAENRLGGSIGWRKSRNMKLSSQYKSYGTGGERISDTVGAGSEDWDEKAKALIPMHVRSRAEMSVQDMLIQRKLVVDKNQPPPKMNTTEMTITEDDAQAPSKRGIFDGLTVYVNGSTYPLISDHKLKHLLAENGAKMSLHLGRRQVTHVILGRPNGSGLSMGAGGGLAATKIQKEIKTVAGCGVKYVGVEWVLESVKAGKRLAETPFSNLKIAPLGQRSVYNMLTRSRGPIPRE